MDAFILTKIFLMTGQLINSKPFNIFLSRRTHHVGYILLDNRVSFCQISLSFTVDRTKRFLIPLISICLIKIKFMKPVDILKVLCGCGEGGGDRFHLMQLHSLLVTPKLSYGSEIYSSATKNRLNALDAVHHA